MPNILTINLGNSGSTGKIASQIGQASVEKGFTYYFAYPERPENKSKNSNDLVIMPYIIFRVSRKLDYIFGNPGLFSHIYTKNFLRKIKKLKIDIIHLHNIHGGFLDLKMLFDFIKKNNICVVWTFHDCWPFTGRCPHFQISGCNRWKSGCHDCVYPRKKYPPSMLERSGRLWNEKKELFLGIQNMTIVTPSVWLSKMVKESFLNKYPSLIINNGIDLNVFKPDQNDFRKNTCPKAKYLVLGVSFGWSYNKGLDVFVELAGLLPPDYQIVLVGTDSKIDKTLPRNIISINKTNNQKELASIYSSADLFFNPSREENFPTVNIESLACGTPVLTFNTGGSPEIIDETCGSVIDTDCVARVIEEIVRICENKPYSRSDCVKRAAKFNAKDKFNDYIELYNKLVNC